MADLSDCIRTSGQQSLNTLSDPLWEKKVPISDLENNLMPGFHSFPNCWITLEFLFKLVHSTGRFYLKKFLTIFYSSLCNSSESSVVWFGAQINIVSPPLVVVLEHNVVTNLTKVGR